MNLDLSSEMHLNRSVVSSEGQLELAINQMPNSLQSKNSRANFWALPVNGHSVDGKMTKKNTGNY